MAEAKIAMPTVLSLVPAVNLRGSGAKFLNAVEEALGVALPIDANQFIAAGDHVAIWLGPDEWMVLGEPSGSTELETCLAAALEGVAASVTDVTGNRVTFRLSGPGAADLLAAGCSLDLHPRVFGPGRCAQTILARAGVILLQRDDVPTYDVLVRRSFARYLSDWFASVVDIAAPL